MTKTETVLLKQDQHERSVNKTQPQRKKRKESQRRRKGPPVPIKRRHRPPESQSRTFSKMASIPRERLQSTETRTVFVLLAKKSVIWTA